MIKLRLSLFLAVLLAAASAVLFYPLARAQQTDHAKQIGSRLLCMCGCNQILTQCNHVGCQVSASMLKKLDQAVARREADDLIVQAFVQEYGMMVFAEPPKKGFSRVAWFIPGVSLLAGAILVVFVISRWRGRPGATPLESVAGTKVSPEWLEQGRQRADRETED
jgi:cytochrome c-type biogenesis protein CcmH